MKKKLLLFICIFLGIFSVKATVKNNYANSINNANKYITSFSDYKLYIDQNETLPYIYNITGFSKNNQFKKSGFISKYELELSIYNNETYLFTGSKYWTNTEVSNNVHIVNVRNNNITDLASKIELEEMKPAHYL